LSALHRCFGQDVGPKREEDGESCKLDELDGRKLGCDVTTTCAEELAASWLRPGQLVTVGWQEVMVIKVVKRTVIVESAGKS
jgi:hypothetical protein